MPDSRRPFDGVDHQIGADPLLRDATCSEVMELPVLGLWARFASNSRHVLETIEQAFGAWRAGSGHAPRDVPFRIQVVVFDGREPVVHRSRSGPSSGSLGNALRHVMPDQHRLIAHTAGSFAISDATRRASVIYVTTQLAAHRERFRQALLEPMVLGLLSHFDRHPVHAAGIGRAGRTVLLAGPSGAGKSTLAHLAQTAGIHVLGEDHVWIQLNPECAIWGWPGPIRLLTGRRRGKTDRPLPPESSMLRSAGHPAVAVLARGRVASLEPVPAATIAGALAHDVAPGFDCFPLRHEAVVDRLAARGGWRLTLSDDPRDSLRLLEQMLTH